VEFSRARLLPSLIVGIVTLAEPVGFGSLAYRVLGEAATRSTAGGAIPVLAGVCSASGAEVSGKDGGSG
jgi:drug/metabolite transporter (DMT)-like permease